MKMKKSIFYCVALLMAGCLPSLHPFYNDKTLIFRPELIGKWKGDDDGLWQFKKAGDKEYELRILEDQKELGRFSAHLFEIQGMMFLDLYPDGEPLKELDDFYKIHFLPVHTFMKVDRIDPNLQMRMIDYEEVEKMIENDPNIIKHEVVDDDRIVLTASTDELQRFILENIETIFSDGSDDSSDLIRLEPLYSEQNIIVDPNFVGQWKAQDGRLLSSKIAGEKTYELIFIGNDDTKHEVYANLIRHNNEMFLAVFADRADLDSDKSNSYPFNLIPDWFFRVKQTKSELTLQEINYEEASQILRNNTSPLQNQPADTNIVFRGTRTEP